MSEEDYEQRLERAIVEMHLSGVSKLNSRPVYFRVLRVLGFELRPPLYCDPLKLFVINFVYIAAVWAGLLYIVQSKTAEGVSTSIVQMSLVAGLVFSAIMYGLNVYKKRKYELSAWEEL